MKSDKQLEFVNAVRRLAISMGLNDSKLVAAYTLLINSMEAKHHVSMEKHIEYAEKTYASYLKHMKGIKVDA